MGLIKTEFIYPPIPIRSHRARSQKHGELMMSKTELWDRVCKTDPKHVKPITGKQYSGNSPKPYYIVRRLTEEFGPCGTGWGFAIVDERFERLSETDVLHVARIEFWYGADRNSFQQMGQTKAAYLTSKGTLLVDEDAPKKSVTDALVKCASYLGFAGDIFMGAWDDSKYVANLKKEFGEESALERDLKASIAAVEARKEVAPPQGIVPMAGTDDAAGFISQERKDTLQVLVDLLLDCRKTGAYQTASDTFYNMEHYENSDEQSYVWHLLQKESTLRNKIKELKPGAQVPAAPQVAKVALMPGLKKTGTRTPQGAQQ